MTDEAQTASFELTLQAEKHIEIVDSDGLFILKVDIRAFRGERQIGNMKRCEIISPMSGFEDEAQAREWADQAFRSFRARSTEALLHEAVMSMADEANDALRDLEIENVDMAGVFKAHVLGTEARLKERLEENRAGRRSDWNMFELSVEVTRALRALPKHERTYAKVAAKLKEMHGEKAPDSGDALRKMLERNGLDWKEMKSGRISKLDVTAA